METTPAETFASRLREGRLLGIIRGSDPEACVATARVLAEVGVSMIEVSLTGVQPLDVLQRVCEQAGPEVEIGAGTVLTEHEVDLALSAGATFIVTPAVAPSVPYAAARGVPVLCGALTPTEIVAARSHGADAIKIFPAGRFGADYLHDLRAPFPNIAMVPVGGVGLRDIVGYLDAGASAVGLASPLCGDAPDGGSLDALRERAARFLQETDR